MMTQEQRPDEAMPAADSGVNAEKKSVLKKVTDKAKSKVKKLGSKLKPKTHGDESKRELIDDSTPGDQELDDMDNEEEESTETTGTPPSHPDPKEMQVPLDEFALLQQKEKKDMDDNLQEFKKSDDLTAGLPSQAIAEQQEPADALQAVPTNYKYKEDQADPQSSSSKAQADQDQQSAASEQRKDGSIFTSESGDSVQTTPREVEALSQSNLYTGEPDIKTSSHEQEHVEDNDAKVTDRESEPSEVAREAKDDEQRELPGEHVTPRDEQKGDEAQATPQLLDDPMAQEQEAAKPPGTQGTAQADEHLGDSNTDASGLGQESAESKLEDEISTKDRKGDASDEKSEDNFMDARSTDEGLERTDDAPSVQDIKENEPEALPRQTTPSEPRDLEQENQGGAVQDNDNQEIMKSGDDNVKEEPAVPVKTPGNDQAAAGQTSLTDDTQSQLIKDAKPAVSEAQETRHLEPDNVKQDKPSEGVAATAEETPDDQSAKEVITDEKSSSELAFEDKPADHFQEAKPAGEEKAEDEKPEAVMAEKGPYSQSEPAVGERNLQEAEPVGEDKSSPEEAEFQKGPDEQAAKEGVTDDKSLSSEPAAPSVTEKNQDVEPAGNDKVEEDQKPSPEGAEKRSEDQQADKTEEVTGDERIGTDAKVDNPMPTASDKPVEGDNSADKVPDKNASSTGAEESQAANPGLFGQLGYPSK